MAGVDDVDAMVLGIVVPAASLAFPAIDNRLATPSLSSTIPCKHTRESACTIARPSTHHCAALPAAEAVAASGAFRAVFRLMCNREQRELAI
jgi:hypothetical protein